MGSFLRADEPLRETTIYIPYEEFWKTFEGEDRGVFLPYPEFRKLWDAAREATAKTPPDAPEGAHVAEIAGVAEVTEGVARVTARLEIDVLNAGWHEVPLNLKGVTVGSARAGDAPARVRGNAADGYTLLLYHADEAPARHAVDLEFTVALLSETAQQGVRGFDLSLPPAPVSRWELRIPEPGVELTLSPRLAVTEAPGGDPETETRVQLFLAAAPAFSARWIPRVEGARDLDALVQSHTTHRTRLASDYSRTEATVRLNVSRAPVESVTFLVPAGERVVDVNADGLRAWSVREADEQQRVEVTFLRPVRAQQEVNLRMERYQPPPLRRVPVVEVEGSVLSSGQIAVELDGDLRADVVDSAGLTRLAGQAQGSAAGFHYMYSALPAALALEVEPVLPRITANALLVAEVDPEAVNLRGHTALNIQRAGVFELTLDVPDGYELVSLATDGTDRVDRHRLGEASDGRRPLHVEFTTRVTGALTLNWHFRREGRVEALLTPEGGEHVFEFPVVRTTGETVVTDEGNMVVAGPGFLEFRVVETAGLRPLPAMPSLPRGRVTSGNTAQFAFAYATETPVLRVAATRKAPHVTVEQLLSVRVEPGVAHFEATLWVNARYSGVRGVRVDVPTDLVERLQLREPQMRRSVMADAENLAEGMTALMLEGPPELLGTHQFTLFWETPVDALAAGEEQAMSIPRLIPRGVDRASGQIVLRKADALDIAVGRVASGLTPIDPRHDLIRRRTFPDAALAFEFHGDWDLEASVTRYEPAVLRSTAIERGLVRQVRTRGGQTSVQALYRVRSTRQRLEIELPADTVFDSRPLRLNGRPVTLERGAGDRVVIPLTGQTADEAFLLDLRYTQREGSGSLRLPHFVEDPAAQKIFLSVHIPDNAVYAGQGGKWNPEFVWRAGRRFRLTPSANRSNAELLRWVSDGVDVDQGGLDQLAVDGQHLLFSALAPNTEGVALRIRTFPLIPFYVIMIGAGVALGIALVRAPLNTRLVVVGALVALLVLMAVFTPALARAVINDAVAGGAALVLILWFVWDVVVRFPRWRKTLAPAGPRGGTPPPPPPPPTPQAPKTPAVEKESGDEA